jgi:L-threonylcarbamoyladenylate synthase
MKTRIYSKSDLEIKAVQDDIKTTFQEGGNVVFPTETVYGIGASALSHKGILGIYSIKGRPNDNPLIMHLASTEKIEDYVLIKHPYATKLMNAFWPGPLTLVLDKKESVPDYFTGGLQTVGVRIPGSEVARKIIEIAGVPVCAPSANISGRPSATLFKHVLEDFNHRVDILIDGGKSEVGLESTVLDVTTDIPVVLRPGMITVEMIKEIVGEVEYKGELEQHEIPRSPGMKYKHYAPKANMTIVEGEQYVVVEYINKQTVKHNKKGEKVGVIVTSDIKNSFITPHQYTIGSIDNETEIASNLFAALREMDTLHVDYIYTLSFHNGKYSDAIMNRLLKAANHQVKQVTKEDLYD